MSNQRDTFRHPQISESCPVNYTNLELLKNLFSKLQGRMFVRQEELRSVKGNYDIYVEGGAWGVGGTGVFTLPRNNDKGS